MKSAIAIIIGGLLLSAAAFCWCFYWGTAAHRGLLEKPSPELEWLRKEFHLSEAELARITALHDAYRPHCETMCRRIDEQGAGLRQLLAATNTMTPEIEATIIESAKLRAECQRDMLKHFLDVSRTMSPERGRRYLEWILERTFIRARGDMDMMAH